MGLVINLFEPSTWTLDPVQTVVQDHAHHIIKRLDWHVAARLAPPASWACHHPKQVRGVLKLAEPCRCCRSLRPLGASLLPMHGMQRGEAGLTFFGLGTGAPTAVELALLSLAGLQGRPPTLRAGSGALRGATQTLDFFTGDEKMPAHGSTTKTTQIESE